VVGDETAGRVFNITIRNNVLSYAGSYGVDFYGPCPSGVVVDHNVFFQDVAGQINPGCPVDASGGSNVTADPLFTDYASRNLHLQSGSPAVDHATNPWSEASDADARSRPQSAGPDIGAYER
jgi:hypothetical protein